MPVPEQIGKAAQPQDVGKFRDNIPAQRKAELLHEVREFMRTKGIVGFATYGCIEVRRVGMITAATASCRKLKSRARRLVLFTADCKGRVPCRAVVRGA